MKEPTPTHHAVHVRHENKTRTGLLDLNQRSKAPKGSDSNQMKEPFHFTSCRSMFWARTKRNPTQSALPLSYHPPGRTDRSRTGTTRSRIEVTDSYTPPSTTVKVQANYGDLTLPAAICQVDSFDGMLASLSTRSQASGVIGVPT